MPINPFGYVPTELIVQSQFGNSYTGVKLTKKKTKRGVPHKVNAAGTKIVRKAAQHKLGVPNP